MSEIEEYEDDNEINDKQAFLAEVEKLRPDLMNPEIWSDSDRTMAAEMLRPSKTKANMLSSIPMICRAEDCPVADACPLMDKGIAPKGKICPIESAFVHQLFTDYIEELDVDTDRMVEVSMVRDLVDQEIQQLRKTWVLSREHFIQDNVVGVDENGKVVTQKDLHKAVDYEDKILKRKEKLRNALLATRESKAKAGQGTKDQAQLVSSLMEQARQIQIDKEKDLRKKLGIEDTDDYIEAEILKEEEEEKEKGDS